MDPCPYYFVGTISICRSCTSTICAGCGDTTCDFVSDISPFPLILYWILTLRSPTDSQTKEEVIATDGKAVKNWFEQHVDRSKDKIVAYPKKVLTSYSYIVSFLLIPHRRHSIIHADTTNAPRCYTWKSHQHHLVVMVQRHWVECIISSVVKPTSTISTYN